MVSIAAATPSQSINSFAEFGHNSDLRWMIFDVFVWAHLELQLGLVCASAPTLRVLFRRYLSQILQRPMHGSCQRIESRQSVRRLDPNSIRRASGAEDYDTMERSEFGRGVAGKSSKGDLKFCGNEDRELVSLESRRSWASA